MGLFSFLKAKDISSHRHDDEDRNANRERLEREREERRKALASSSSRVSAINKSTISGTDYSKPSINSTPRATLASRANSTTTTSKPLTRASSLNASSSTSSTRSGFQPSTYPGASKLSLEAQKIGFEGVERKLGSSTPAISSDEGVVSSRSVSDMQFRRFAAYIEEKSGIVLGNGKQYLVNSRLSTLLLRFKINSIDEIINLAMEPEKNKEIASAVIDAMTTNETLWFRDTYPYLALKNIILPDLAKRRKNPVRIWSAACSSGQEPYSIAMVVQEQAAQMIRVPAECCQIVGTDLSPEMLERSRCALYDSHALARGLSAERKKKFFKPTTDPNVMQVDDKVRSMVAFRQLNLLGTYALLGKFDVIFCRNVLIYFNNEVKSQIVNKFALSLNPGGYLFLGSSESLNGLSDKYEMIRCNPGIVYKLKQD